MIAGATGALLVFAIVKAVALMLLVLAVEAVVRMHSETWGRRRSTAIRLASLGLALAIWWFAECAPSAWGRVLGFAGLAVGLVNARRVGDRLAARKVDDRPPTGVVALACWACVCLWPVLATIVGLKSLALATAPSLLVLSVMVWALEVSLALGWTWLFCALAGFGGLVLSAVAEVPRVAVLIMLGLVAAARCWVARTVQRRRHERHRPADAVLCEVNSIPLAAALIACFFMYYLVVLPAAPAALNHLLRIGE